MIVRELLAEMAVATVTGTQDATVAGLSLDSRCVKPGDLFFALPGVLADGARFASAAVDAGAVAVVGPLGLRFSGATVAEVAEPRLALAQAANRFYDAPSRDMQVVAVTGTNGKTTTTYLLEAIFAAAGLSSGVIGTTGVRFAGELRPSAFTTPEAPDLQALLAEMRGRGVRAVALEASSHALAQRRTWGLAVDVAIFTNLTRDHLDYHGTMEAYLDAKLMLFDGRNGFSGKSTVAVIDADDAAAPRVAEAALRGGQRVVRFGEAADADLRIASVRTVEHGLELVFSHDGAEYRFLLPLWGRYNAWNAAAAFAAARALGIDAQVAVNGLQRSPGVAGRLDRVEAGQPFAVVVDYAHTPDALERALAACREHTRARVLCVVGCGGDRDRGKRPHMGRLAATGADQAWITNDNPRSEDPATIAAEVAAGAPSGALTVILDRHDAIAAALEVAQPGDVVLIAGKGHETTQTIGTQVFAFDDRDVVRTLLTKRPRA
ncbi:MAG: UDP-N-acetylmuramoyl-L-alanyl-D-glutamate--2,6-diaminopimelate ligase [Candidatus Eisenbacteria bacterium]